MHSPRKRRRRLPFLFARERRRCCPSHSFCPRRRRPFVAARSAAFNRCVTARSAGAFRCILFSALPVALSLCGSHRRSACSSANRRAGTLQSCSSLARRPAVGTAKPDACEAAAARAPARASSGLVGPEEGLQLHQHHGQLKLPRPAQPATRVVQLLTWQRVR